MVVSSRRESISAGAVVKLSSVSVISTDSVNTRTSLSVLLFVIRHGTMYSFLYHLSLLYIIHVLTQISELMETNSK